MAREIRVGGLRIDIGVGFDNVRTGLDKAAKLLKGFESKAKAAFKPIGLPGTLGFTAIGAAALKAGKDFDNATAIIIRQTGATDEQLVKLKDSFAKVFARGDDSSEEVANAISLISSKTGLAGTALENLSSTLLDLVDVTGGDLGSTLENSAKLFENWGIEVAKQTETLDFFLAVSQATGVAFGTLEAGVTKFAAPLRGLGLSLEDSAIILAQLEKSGVSAEKVFAGLQVALVNFTKKGKDPKEAFEGLLKAVKSADDATAILLAKNAVGAKNAVVFADAVRSGRFETEKLTEAIGNYGGRIADTATRSETLAQKLSKLGNAALTLGSVLGEPIIDGMKVGLDVLSTAVANLALTLRSTFQAAGIIVSQFLDSLKKEFPLTFDFLRGIVNTFVDFVSQAFGFLMEKVASYLEVLKGLALAIPEALSGLPGGGFFSPIAASIRKAAEETNALLKNNARFQQLRSDIVGTAKGADDLSKAMSEVGSQGAPATVRLGGALGDAEKKAKAAAAAVESLKEKLASLHSENDISQIKSDIEKALEVGDLSGIEALRSRLGQAVYDATLTGYSDAILKGGKKAEQLAIEISSETRKQAIEETNIKVSDHLTKKMRESYEKSTQFFQSVFENGITGIAFSLEDMFKRLAVGFAAQIASQVAAAFPSIGTLLGGATSLEGFGMNLAKLLMGGASSGQSFGDILSSTLFGSQANGRIGPVLESGNFDPGIISDFGTFTDTVFQGANTLGAWGTALASSISSIKKLGHGASETADGIVEMGFSAAGAYFGGPIGAQLGSIIGDKVGDLVGGLFGSAPTNPETLARLDFQKKINELLDKINGLPFFDSQGELQKLTSVDIGSNTRFNAPNWVQDFVDQFGDQNFAAFTGIGEALRETLGITEDIGGQIGAILLDQTGGSIDALKGIVDAAGITFDKFVEIMINRGKQGAQSWLEIVSQINAGTEAFQKGLAGTGQYIEAFKQALKTGGKGALALTKIQAIAIEAKEAGVKSFDELRAKLAASGEFTAQEIEALFSALASNGIGTLDALAAATDLQLAKVVAAIDAFFQDHGSKWEEATKGIQETANELDKLDGRNVEINFEIKTKLDKATEAVIESGLLDSTEVDFNVDATANGITQAASGGILKRAAFISPGVLAGEAGPEGILPLRNINGELGVKYVGEKSSFGNVTINVDARGAERGVHEDILNAIEERAVERSVRAVMEFMDGSAL